jgi:hypothetical protein
MIKKLFIHEGMHRNLSETNQKSENKFSMKITVLWDLANIPEEPATSSSEKKNVTWLSWFIGFQICGYYIE